MRERQIGNVKWGFSISGSIDKHKRTIYPSPVKPQWREHPQRQAQESIQSLEKLVYDNPNLEKLEAMLDNFNPFEAMQWTRQEARHSAFLRWLLDPHETHGLGSYCLKAFAKRIAHRAAGTDTKIPSVFDIETWSLSKAEVLQEWNNIDILVRDDDAHFLLVVENKVDSGEHSNQLQKYRQFIENRFPDYSKLFAFLTVGGVAATDESYVSVDYAELASLVADTTERKRDQLAAEVRDFLLQYVEMVRRYIVEDSEIQRLCRSIYDNHKRALDAIFEYKPDKILEVSEELKKMLDERPDLETDHCTKSYIRFIPREIDFLPRIGEGWTPSGRIILFETQIYDNRITLRMILGPGPQDARERIRDVITENTKVFNWAHRKFYPQYWSFHRLALVDSKRFEELDVPAIRKMVEKRLNTFLEDIIPKCVNVLASLRSLEM